MPSRGQQIPQFVPGSLELVAENDRAAAGLTSDAAAILENPFLITEEL